MKRVFVDLQKIKNLHSGLGVFCIELGKALLKQQSEFSFTFYVPENKMNCFGSESQYIAARKIDKFFFSVNSRFDVWHCTHQDSKVFPKDKTTKVLLTIHDVNFLYKYSGIKQKIKQMRLQKSINKADAVVYISEFTKNEVRRNFIVKNKIERVIYNGLRLSDEVTKPDSVSEKELYFFTIGIIQPKKNTHVLPQILSGFPNHKLVISGKCDDKYKQKILDEARSNNVEDRLLFTGEVTDAEKNWLFRNCAAYFFPSLAEGFGLSVAEAMSHGKPVFLSDKTALPEIGGSDCFYWNNFEKSQMIDVVENGLDTFRTDSGLQSRLMKRAALFNWDKTAKEYLSIYKTLST